MNCEFCGRDLHLSHYEKNKEIAVYDCTYCPVLTSFYFLEETGARLKTTFMIDRKGRLYMWTNNYTSDNSYITDVNASLSSSFEKDPQLIKFPKIMNITPENVTQKFSFYMTFI